MALPSTVFRVNIQLADIDRGVYESIQATVAQHPSETEERLIARLLAMAIFYEPGLMFTKGLSATDEPDLWVIGPDGRAQFWVEVGLPDADRIIKASRHSARVALLACGRTLSNWEQQHFARLERIANLMVVSIDQGFLATLVAQLQRSINWSITISGGILYLTVATDTYEAALQIKSGTF